MGFQPLYDSRMVENAREGLVVVGDDGSPAADVVWQWLTSHPWDGWEIEVVTADAESAVWGEPVAGKPWSPSWARAATPPGAIGVSHLKYACDPRVMLAERSDADLVVVGRHRGTGRFGFLGSTSEWLVHDPPAPLAVIGQGDRMTKVLLAVDGSAHSDRALEVFGSLPGSSAAAAVVVTVDDGRADTAAAGEAASALEGRVASVETEILPGRPTEALLRAIADTGADMVVLGTKGLTGWQRIRVGSTAGALVRRAECNMLVAAAESE